MSLTFVSEQLLAANKLSHQDLYNVLGQLAERRLDYADLYFQSSYHEAWVIEDGIIKDGSYNIDQGVGVRAVSGEKTGFAYADQITLNALQQSAQAARSIVRDSGNGRATPWVKSAIRRCIRCSIRCRACRAKRKSPCCIGLTRRRAPPISGCRK
ncbi:protease TldD [Serratia entomophila]|nr:protease TldD [Serratia entomophila]